MLRLFNFFKPNLRLHTIELVLNFSFLDFMLVRHFLQDAFLFIDLGVKELLLVLLTVDAEVKAGDFLADDGLGLLAFFENLLLILAE